MKRPGVIPAARHPDKESDPMKRLVLGLGLVALAVVTVACSGGSGASASAPAASAPAASAPAGDTITVIAKDLKFSTASITAPADEAFQIILDNQESAPHNIAIKDAAGAEVFKGEIVSSTTVTNDIPALPAGPYEFWCEVHPDMKGTLTAG
jgi:plastocyanin